jgi:hypothetical protein
MQKIPCLFEREFHGPNKATLLQKITPGAEWVIEGMGSASIKYDGTACMVKDGRLYRRYDAKRGKPAPKDGIACTKEADPITGHWPHWIPVTEGAESKWHLSAWEDQLRRGKMLDGTYELCGPHFQGNPHKMAEDRFIQHGLVSAPDMPVFPIGVTVGYVFETLRRYLEPRRIEGIVWAHPEYGWVKLRRKDYGFEWPVTLGWE